MKFLVAIALAFSSLVYAADEPASVTQFREGFFEAVTKAKGDTSKCQVDFVEMQQDRPLIFVMCTNKPNMCMVLISPDEEESEMECMPNPGYVPEEKI